MTIHLSQILKDSTAQAFRGLTNVLTKAKAAAEARRKAAAGGGKPSAKGRKPSQRPAVPR